jgi:hypothetical protein
MCQAQMSTLSENPRRLEMQESLSLAGRWRCAQIVFLPVLSGEDTRQLKQIGKDSEKSIYRHDDR